MLLIRAIAPRVPLEAVGSAPLFLTPRLTLARIICNSRDFLEFSRHVRRRERLLNGTETPHLNDYIPLLCRSALALWGLWGLLWGPSFNLGMTR